VRSARDNGKVMANQLVLRGVHRTPRDISAEKKPPIENFFPADARGMFGGIAWKGSPIERIELLTSTRLRRLTEKNSGNAVGRPLARPRAVPRGGM